MVSYGGVSGGTRGVVALRPVFGALGLVGTTPIVEIAWASSQVNDDGEFEPTDKNEQILAAQLNDPVVLDDALRPLRKAR